MRMGNWKFRSGISLLVVSLTALFTVGGISRADAQVERLPSWGVIPFENMGPSDPKVGAMAATAVGAEFAKLGTVDVLPLEQSTRKLEELGLRIPVTQASQLSRLGQDLGVSTIVSGEIKGYRVVSSNGDKRGEVLVRVFVRDVASGITINGAAVAGASGWRAGSTEAEALMNEALQDAAFKAVHDIEGRRLPTSTVLTTLGEKTQIDKGARDGMKVGMRVIVTRGRDQVAIAKIVNMDADTSILTPEQVFKGLKSGDKARVIFDVPDIKVGGFTADGGAKPVRQRSTGSNAGLVSVLILVVILGFLFGQGRGSSTSLVGGVISEATVSSADAAGARISWTRDAFFRGNNEGPVRYQVWRDDNPNNPVAVAPGTSSSTVDDALNTNAPVTGSDWDQFPSPGGIQCDFTAPPGGGTPVVVALSAGRPYRYSVEVVYRISGLSLPGNGTSGSTSGGTTGTTTGGTTGTTTGGTTGTTTGGTTGTTTGGTTGTTTGGTTGGNTGGTGGTAEWCYFISQRVAAKGLATPLVRPALRTPNNDDVVTTPITFQFTSVRGSVSSVQIEYALQLSTDPGFPADRTITLDPFVELVAGGGTTVSTPTTDVSGFFGTSNFLYWRIGARNIEDDPGPVADNAGKRYIYSSVRRIRKTIVPPSASK